MKCIIVLGLLALAGCAQPQAPVYPIDATVHFSPVETRISNVKIVDGHEMHRRANLAPDDPNAKWVALLVEIKNISGAPLHTADMPTFNLRALPRERGIVYEENNLLGYQSDSVTGYSSIRINGALNPLLSVKRGLFYQLPPGKYDLEVLVPYASSGVTMYSNRYFYDVINVD